MLKLIDRLTTVHIVAHRETTTQLETYLHTQGFTPQVSRQIPTPAMATYSPSYRCLLNHHSIWQQIAPTDRPALIIEADFIPIQNLSQAPIPSPIDSPNLGITWLYTCAPQLYSVTAQGHAQGFSAATVAYILTPPAAQALLTFPDRYAQTPDRYATWDCELAEYLTQRGFINYIPYRNYGEHDGTPNPEHRRHGLSAIHRADLLHDRLAFPPTYATQPHHRWLERSRARSKGLLRLLTGRYLRPKIYRNSSVPLRLLRFALLRQISRQPP
jgi:hypothetical protein